MNADNILCFLHDLLDYSKCPQADAFNILFNNIDVYYVFKMKLPLFVKNNSPQKNLATKLLHQFIREKPIVEEESISLFFSSDATKNNILAELMEAFHSFLRYHRRQISSSE